MNNLLDIFQIEKTCEYRGEIYRVRDNGAIYRCRKLNKRKRPLDEKWTFGNPNTRTGYMNISSETVHRIVATAFHGQQPSDKHVVDHVDTNRRNNRPENLRWLTRMENLLLNPTTLSRIIFRYGSIDNFFSDPSKPLNRNLDSNFEWMRTVTKEESENTRNNIERWAKEGEISKYGTLGEWVFSKYSKSKDEYNGKKTMIQSITPNAFQKNWKTPSEFPNCPTSIIENALTIYKQRLSKSRVFSKNEYGESFVEYSEINKTTNELLILTSSDNIKPYALAKVYVDEKGFIHESIRKFFTLTGAQKHFNLALGIKWEGEDSIDDYS